MLYGFVMIIGIIYLTCMCHVNAVTCTITCPFQVQAMLYIKQIAIATIYQLFQFWSVIWLAQLVCHSLLTIRVLCYGHKLLEMITFLYLFGHVYADTLSSL